MQHNFWLAKPYGLANQKGVLHSSLEIVEKKTRNILENG